MKKVRPDNWIVKPIDKENKSRDSFLASDWLYPVAHVLDLAATY